MSKFKVGDEVWIRAKVVVVDDKDPQHPVGMHVKDIPGCVWPSRRDVYLGDVVFESPPDLSAYTSHTSAEMVEWCGGRGVVRGHRPLGIDTMCEPGFNAGGINQPCRAAWMYTDRPGAWMPFLPGGMFASSLRLTESQAIAWVLDGVLPTS